MPKTETKPCLVCGKRLWNIFGDSGNQADDACYFRTNGQYGSTVFDPMDGSFLEINVCDECLVRARGDKRVLIGREAKPVMYEGSVVGWCRTPDRPLMDWTGDEGRAYEDDSNNILHVDEDDLRNAERLPEIKWNIEPRLLLGGTA